MRSSIEVRLLDKDSAPFMAEIVQTVYGASFSELHVPSSEEALARQESGDEVVAMAFSGAEAAGFVSLKRMPSNPRLYELGMLSVMPGFRSGTAAWELVRFVREEFTGLVDFAAVYMENVTSHRYSQRLAARAGAVDTAILLSAMPALAAPRERLSFVISCYEKHPVVPCAVYIPPCYQSVLPGFYEGLAPRLFYVAGEHRPDSRRSMVTRHEYPTVGTVRAYVDTVGEDFAMVAKDLSHCCQNSITAVQVYLPLADPGVGYAVARLRAEGFFLGGVLPFCFDGDGLIMQKCGPAVLEKMHLYSSKSQELLQVILAEAKSVNFL